MVAIGPQTDIGIQHADEPIGRWFLEDGSFITYKTVATAAKRIEGRYDQYGNPIYHMSYTTIMTTKAPDSVKDPSMRPENL